MMHGTRLLFLLQGCAAVEQALVGEDALDLALLQPRLSHQAELLVEEARLVLEPVPSALIFDPARALDHYRWPGVSGVSGPLNDDRAVIRNGCNSKYVQGH